MSESTSGSADLRDSLVFSLNEDNKSLQETVDRFEKLSNEFEEMHCMVASQYVSERMNAIAEQLLAEVKK